MITCAKCSKQNQDHYKFCLGCGSKLEGAAPAAPVAAPPVPGVAPRLQPPVVAPAAPVAAPAVAPRVGAPSLAAPAVPAAAPVIPSVPVATPVVAPGPGAAAPAAASGACSSCGMANPPGFAFCGRCGNRLGAAPAGGGTSVGPAPMAAQPAAAAAPAPMAARPADMGSARTMFVDAAPPPSRPAPAPAPVVHAARIIMLGADGAPLGELLLRGETLHIGRGHGSPWDDDAYLDMDHVGCTPAPGGLQIRDAGSLNGIYFKLEGRTDLRSGDVFRVGQELLRFEELPEPTAAPDGTERMGSPNPGYWGRVCVLVDPDLASAAYPIHAETLAIGRDRGDVQFPRDGYVSGNHCRVVADDTGVWLEDLGSSNGTYVRVRDGAVVPFGKTLLVGQRLLKVEPA